MKEYEGVISWHTIHSENWLKIVNPYVIDGTITNYMFGHEHTILVFLFIFFYFLFLFFIYFLFIIFLFFILFYIILQLRPIVPNAFYNSLSGSLSPIFGNNPSFRVNYFDDQTLKVVDWSDYVLKIENGNGSLNSLECNHLIYFYFSYLFNLIILILFISFFFIFIFYFLFFWFLFLFYFYFFIYNSQWKDFFFYFLFFWFLFFILFFYLFFYLFF